MSTNTRFLRPQHPKAAVAPRLDAIERIFALGWVAQVKMNGRRAQIHIPPGEAVHAYTRQGSAHTKPIPHEMDMLLHQWFGAAGALTVLDCEWLPFEEKLYVFDALVLDGKRLDNLTFPERHALLFRDFINPKIKMLPILKTARAAWAALQSPDPAVEGIVLRSTMSRGWPDTAIVRCRRK